MLLMRTTIDIPEDLLRRAKAQAALRGIRLKDFVAKAVELALSEPKGSGERISSHQKDSVRIAKGCEFPLIRGECGPAMRDLTPERISEILQAEDV